MFETGLPRAGEQGAHGRIGPERQLGSSTTMRAQSIARELEGLAPMGLEQLRAYWRRRYGDAPAIRSPELLRLMLAWRLQAAVWGGLDESVRRRLRRAGAAKDTTLDLPIGARLAREWKGDVHEVIIAADGCVWRGRTFASLSAVAREITGVRWNGPRFFGLRNRTADE